MRVVRPSRPRPTPRPVAVTRPTSKPRYVVDWSLPPGRLFNLYMMTSYLYYECAASVVTDSDYDKLCTLILRNWARIRHPHKALVTREDMEATTGYTLRGRYPTIVKHAAMRLLAEYQDI